jgi:hypothetical protein
LIIPAAAFWLKKNLGGASASATSGKDEDSPPPLGHSKESAIQHSPGAVVKPEVGQRCENDSEISSVLAGQKPGNILQKQPSPSAQRPVSDPGGVEEEAAPLTCQPYPAPSYRKVLAREAPHHEVHPGRVSVGGDIIMPGHAGPVPIQHRLTLLVELDLRDNLMPSTL